MIFKSMIAALFWLAAFSAPVWAADVGHDCAEGSDEDIVAETQPAPPAGV